MRRELEERVKQLDKEAAHLRQQLDEKTRWLKTAPEVREAFTRYDRDKNGKLDGGELRAALQHIGLNPNLKEASELLKSYDADRSGTMEMDEFVLLVEDLRRLGHDLAQSEMAKLRAELDAARRHLDTAQRNMGDVFATFQRFDRSRNGRLEYREV